MSDDSQETVRCEAIGCMNSSTVRFRGTLPRGWFAKWYGVGNYPRVCSEACLDKLKHERAQP